MKVTSRSPEGFLPRFPAKEWDEPNIPFPIIFAVMLPSINREYYPMSHFWCIWVCSKPLQRPASAFNALS